MSLEYYAKPQVEVGDLLKPDYQAFIGDIEKGVSTFESSTGTFMTDMVRFGPSKYDISVVYENLAISQIENAQGRWGNLRVYYPQQTLWSDHPAAILQGPWVSPAQKAAARTWLAHLRGREAQERALAFGFRPGDHVGAGEDQRRRAIPYTQAGAVRRPSGHPAGGQDAGRQRRPQPDDHVDPPGRHHERPALGMLSGGRRRF